MVMDNDKGNIAIPDEDALRRSVDQLSEDPNIQQDIMYPDIADIDLPDLNISWFDKFGMANWQAIEIIFYFCIALAIIYFIHSTIMPWYHSRYRSEQWEEDVVEMDSERARNLLEQAEDLARQGQYEEAVHFLLYRSIEDIDRQRPNILRPSNTSREIGAMDILSENTRAAFMVITQLVEQGIFARLALNETSWIEAKSAYQKLIYNGGEG